MPPNTAACRPVGQDIGQLGTNQNHGYTPHRYIPHRRASYRHTSHRRVSLTGVHLIGVHLIGVYLIGVLLTGVYLIGVHLTGVYLLQVYISYRPVQLVGVRVLIFEKFWPLPVNIPLCWVACGSPCLVFLETEDSGVWRKSTLRVSHIAIRRAFLYVFW
jgi:hypothetical protein